MSTTYQINKVSKLPEIKTPQVKQLAEILKNHGGKVYDHGSLPKILANPILKTRQDPYLIFKYYQRELVRLGILTILTVKSAVVSKTEFEAGAGI